MSEVTEELNNGQQAIYNYDTSKIFIRENRYITATYTNGSGDTVVLTPGMLMGRIGSSQKAAILTSAATNGSEFPLGILASYHSVADGASVTVTICIAGDVAEEKVVLAGADTLATLLPDDRSLRDHIAGDTMGIKLVTCDEMTNYDND